MRRAAGLDVLPESWRDARLERPVALKVLPARFAENERFRERLLRESRLAASLDHPNVVPVYDAGEIDGRLFIAMRYVDGLDLKTLLRDNAPLALGRVVAIAGQIAEALDAAHQRGLVHRDVKPSNVLLDQQGDRDHAYLADFGLTRSSSAAGPTDGQFMGTVDYVAPEQIRGDDVDGRADQYALGCLLFECLTGSLPFRQRSEVAAIFAHLEEAAPAASERRETLPPAVDPVLARAMAKEPAERFDSCRELVAATHDALGLATSPPSARALARAGARAGGPRTRQRRRRARRRPRTRRPAPPGRTARSRTSTRGRTASAARPTSRAIPRRWPRPPAGVWMADFREGVLWRYDPHTKTRQRISSNGEPRDIAALGDQVYVAVDGNTFTGVGRALRRRDGRAHRQRRRCSPARSRRATASCGRRAARTSIASAPVGNGCACCATDS